MESNILYLLTRSPLHIGSGNSVGAVDQPVQREKHTGFPIIPGSSLKGCLADRWIDTTDQDNEFARGQGESAWLFGADEAENASAGALLIGEGHLLAFPIRSAKGSFAWITSPLIIGRAVRDKVLSASVAAELPEPADNEAYLESGDCPLVINGNLVLEDYPFEVKKEAGLKTVCDKMQTIFGDDPVLQQIGNRLVVLSDGMMSFFVRTACDVAQHVRINPETGTAKEGALFNQENVPSETLFYASIHGTDSRLKGGNFAGKQAADALAAFAARTSDPLQIGADAGTGLGWCSIALSEA